MRASSCARSTVALLVGRAPRSFAKFSGVSSVGGDKGAEWDNYSAVSPMRLPKARIDSFQSESEPNDWGYPLTYAYRILDY